MGEREGIGWVNVFVTGELYESEGLARYLAHLHRSLIHRCRENRVREKQCKRTSVRVYINTVTGRGVIWFIHTTQCKGTVSEDIHQHKVGVNINTQWGRWVTGNTAMMELTVANGVNPPTNNNLLSAVGGVRSKGWSVLKAAAAVVAPASCASKSLWSSDTPPVPEPPFAQPMVMTRPPRLTGRLTEASTTCWGVRGCVMRG